jgi:acyl carrier protein
MKQAKKEDIIQIIKKLDLDIKEPDAIDASMPLQDQGIDSLDMMNIYFELEDKFGIKISDETLEDKDWSTIEAIVKNVNEMLSN